MRSAARQPLHPSVSAARRHRVVLWVLDRRPGDFLTTSTAFSVLQQFATVGPIALGLGLSMIIREIDLSVGGMLSLAGCIAVLTGGEYPIVGVALAVLFGLVWGLFQGAIMTSLRLGSIGVTLGGLLTLGGLAYVVTGNLSISYPRMDVAMAVNHPLLGVLSLRSLIALAAFLVAAFVMARTRVGRDVYATGSDRRAAMVAGVRTSAIVLGVFACSGMLAALGGALLELQPGGRLRCGAHRRSGSGDRGRDHRRRVAERRQGHADRHCRWCVWFLAC